MRISPPSYAERVLFAGSNGSGKSVLARSMLGAGYPRWIAIDVKGDFEPIGDYTVLRTPTDPRWFWHGPAMLRPGHILYRPKPEYADGPWIDYVLKLLFVRGRREGKKRPFVIYIDECLYLSKTGNTRWLAAIAITGRSLGIGLWVSTQRPVWIPVEVRSEAWRWYVFYLAYRQDEKEIIDYCKGRLTVEQLEEGFENYSFWEIKRGQRSAGKLEIAHCPPIVYSPDLSLS